MDFFSFLLKQTHCIFNLNRLNICFSSALLVFLFVYSSLIFVFSIEQNKQLIMKQLILFLPHPSIMPSYPKICSSFSYFPPGFKQGVALSQEPFRPHYLLSTVKHLFIVYSYSVTFSSFSYFPPGFRQGVALLFLM